MTATVNKKAWLLLGGNVGDTLRYLSEARVQIGLKCGEIAKASSIYQTAAWGKEDQAPFLNQALEINTSLSPSKLLETLLDIEKELGRLRMERWAERTIDIDILYYAEEIISLTNLEVPHPRIQERRFALVPMAEIAPDLVHPLFQKTQKQLLESCPDVLEVKRLE